MPLPSFIYRINLKKASQRLREMIRVLAFFACQEWTFSTDNLQRLRKRLHDTDGHIYHLNINDVKLVSDDVCQKNIVLFHKTADYKSELK